MKHSLLILVLCGICFAANAQVGGIVYQPSTPSSGYQNSYPDPYSQPYQPQSSYRGQGSYQSQPQRRAIRTTAYSFDSYNNTYIKHPIKVIEYHEHGMTKYKVTEEYKSNGYGGQWEKIHYHTPVSQCSPMFGTNSLESRFTHKANVMGTIYYFDLSFFNISALS